MVDVPFRQREVERADLCQGHTRVGDDTIGEDRIVVTHNGQAIRFAQESSLNVREGHGILAFGQTRDRRARRHDRYDHRVTGALHSVLIP